MFVSDGWCQEKEIILPELFKYLQEEKKTLLYVSHTFEAFNKMDEILVFEEGKIVAKGNHETLLKTSEIGIFLLSFLVQNSVFYFFGSENFG